MPAAALPRRPEATTFSVEELIEDTRRGRLRIPEFQRPLRWKAAQVIDLFDSIRRGYPVGELLMDRRPAPATRLHLGPMTLDAPAESSALWIVDGQQRLTSLFVTLARTEKQPAGDDFAIWYDLDQRTFHRHRGGDAPPSWIPLNVILDSADLMKFAMRLMQEEREDWFNEAIQLGKAIREFHLPGYIIDQADDQAVRTIFIRLNTKGVSMKEHEVFQALYTSEGKRPVTSAVDRLEMMNFGRIDEDLFLRCLRILHGNLDKADTEALVERLDDDAVQRTEVALRGTIEVLQRAAIVHIGWLPYRLPLLVIVQLIDRFGVIDSTTTRLAERWIWRGMLTDALGNSSNAAVQSAGSVIAASDDPQAVLVGLIRQTPGANQSLQQLPIKHDPRRGLDQTTRHRGAVAKMLLLAMHGERRQYGVTPPGIWHRGEPSFESLWPAKPVRWTDIVVADPAGLETCETLEETAQIHPAAYALDDLSQRYLLEGDLPGFRVARQNYLQRVLTTFLDHRVGTPDQLRPSVERLGHATP